MEYRYSMEFKNSIEIVQWNYTHINIHEFSWDFFFFDSDKEFRFIQIPLYNIYNNHVLCNVHLRLLMTNRHYKTRTEMFYNNILILKNMGCNVII